MSDEVITSRQNPQIQHLRRLLASRDYRSRTGCFAADGIKLLDEAVQWCTGLETVFLCDQTALPSLPAGVRVVRISRDLMDYVSQMQAPQGAIFVCRIPQNCTKSVCAGALALDGIQDPGNLGTILRTADALGAPLLVLTDGCADLWNPKTIRASMGAAFRMPVIRLTAAELVGQCRSLGLRLLASALSPQAVPVEQARLQNAVMLVGSEGQGVRTELLHASDEQVIIPIRARCESLNAAAAAAVLLWEMRRSGAFAQEE